MDSVSIVSASVPNTAAAAGMVPHSLAVLIWAPLALIVGGGILWLAIAVWLDRRRERAAQAVPARIVLPLDLPLPAAAPALRRVQTAPRKLPAPWLDLDLDFGPPRAAAVQRRARPL